MGKGVGMGGVRGVELRMGGGATPSPLGLTKVYVYMYTCVAYVSVLWGQSEENKHLKKSKQLNVNKLQVYNLVLISR